ncbi:MAG: hypothetical protein AAF799_28780 [Myxococcota bacterium]
MDARFGLLMVLVAAGCGPTVGAESTAGAGSSTDVATSDGPGLTSSTTAADSTTTASPTPGTTALDEGTSVADDSTGECVPPPKADCDPWLQNCCPGQKCVPWADEDGGGVWNARRCSPIAAEPNPVGSPCTVEDSAASGLDDCDATSYCWGVDPSTLQGECVPLCQGSPEEPVCPEGQGCYIANDGILTLCFDRCDPSDPACDDDEACIPLNDDFLCIEHIGTGKVGPGSPCDAPWQCLPEFVCTDAANYPGCAGPGCCTPYCNATTEAGQQQCAKLDPQLACVAFPPELQPAGLEHLGSCQLP